MKEGQVYLSLPLHLTLARFSTDRPAEELLAKTWPIIARTPAVVLNIGETSRFGSSQRPQRVEVNLVEKTKELGDLHMQLFEALNKLEVEYSNANYVGQSFKPHVSRRDGIGLEEGTSYLSRAVYFIEVRRSSHTSSQKFVYARLQLGQNVRNVSAGR